MKKDSSHSDNFLVLGAKILVSKGKKKLEVCREVLEVIREEVLLVIQDVFLPLIKKIPGAVKTGVRDIWAERINRKQLKTFYKPSDYLLAGLHITFAGGLLGVAGVWAGVHSLLGGLGFAAFLTGVSAIGGDHIIKGIFKKRSLPSYKNSNLVGIITRLKDRTALSTFPTLFDLKIDKEELGKKMDVTAAPAQQQRIMNAAAVSLTKPILLVSDSIVENLEPKETEAVLAHEFTHLGAKHSWTGLIAGGLQTATMITAVFGFGGAVLEQSWTTIMLSFGGAIAVSKIGNKLLPKPEDRIARDGTIKPRARRTQMGILATQEALTLGIIAIPAPVTILTAAAIEHGFFWTANLITKSLTRRMEFQADRGAVKLGADPLALITSLRKVTLSLKENEPELAEAADWRKGSLPMQGLKRVESLFRTHPDTMRRCWRLAAMAAAQGRNQAEIDAALYGEINMALYPDNKKPDMIMPGPGSDRAAGS